MIMSDGEIRTALDKGDIKITSKEHEIYIGPSSVDLHLSPFVKKLLEGNILDSKIDNSKCYLGSIEEVIVIHPGDFYLMSTEEELQFGDDISGFIQGRSSLARLGISIHAAGFFDAGFKGTATLEVTNLTRNPIILYPGMRICQMIFAKMGTKSENPYWKKKDSKYMGQIMPEVSKINLDFNQ